MGRLEVKLIAGMFAGAARREDVPSHAGNLMVLYVGRIVDNIVNAGLRYSLSGSVFGRH
jgi:hypothetical protein